MSTDQIYEHLYIHWPFCKNRCHYCDFIALAQHDNFFEPYHAALCKEIEMVAQSMLQKQKIKTIFLGGGTPSLYPTEILKELFCVLNKNFDLSNAQEITIETNPKDINKENLKKWRELGINRLSMGVQILDDAILKKLNRQQTTADVLKAIEIAPDFFENISIDLILGLPSITQNIWIETLQTVVDWPIKHISVYFLTIYEKTPLYFKVENGDFKLSSDNELVDLYEMTINLLSQKKLFQYETSNFSKQNFESIHNQAYWDRKAHYGFGLGASSFDGQKRFTNHNNIELYIKSTINNNSIPISSTESLNQSQIILETLMLSLRQKKGLDLQSMLYLLVGTQKIKFYENIEILKNAYLLKQDNNRIYLSFRGMILENEVILKLCKDLF